MAYLSQRQYLVSLSGLPGTQPSYFMTKTGGNTSSDSSKVYGGGSKVPEIVTGIPETENVTVGRAYDPDRDQAVLAFLRDKVGTWTTTIIVVETDRDYNSLNKGTTYSGSVLVGITEPDFESSSGDPAAFELEFAVVKPTSDPVAP